jgi:hypothetical protein
LPPLTWINLRLSPLPCGRSGLLLVLEYHDYAIEFEPALHR